MWAQGILATFALILAVGKGAAHEFWIDPVEYTAQPGAEFRADLRVGQEFSGSSMSYLPRRFTRFEVHSGQEIIPVEGRLGDIPALSLSGLPQGLAIIAHETSDSSLTYDEWDAFMRFVEHKDFATAAADHAARGLPETGFRESYSRHVRALVAIGDGAGSDRPLGLLTEIVALENPYTDDLSGNISVQVFLRGTPRADAQVELFARDPQGDVTITLHRTDADGIAVLPVTQGYTYMADAVVLEPVDPETEGAAVWHTYWAALTFAVPE